MNKRLVCLVLLAAVTQLFATGCGQVIARWRANHPCGICSHSHPLLHPLQTRRAAVNEGGGSTSGAGASAGGTMANSPCHGCNGGTPVNFTPGGPIPVTPTGYPPIGYPTIGPVTPITPGPTVVPSYELPNPMPLPKQ